MLLSAVSWSDIWQALAFVSVAVFAAVIFAGLAKAFGLIPKSKSAEAAKEAPEQRAEKPPDVLDRNLVYIQWWVGSGLIIFGASILIAYHYADIFPLANDTDKVGQTLTYIATAIIGAGVAVLPVTAAGAASARVTRGFETLMEQQRTESGRGAREGGAPEGGAPEGGAPEGGAPEGGAPEGGAPEGGAPGGGAPEGGAAPEGGVPGRPAALALQAGTVALALSGGGARGDFEVGAVRYLYDHGVMPDIICGCSVGAINGAKLAEGEGGPEFGLRGLEAIWLSLRVNSDMYLEEPWLNEIDPRMKDAFTGHGPVIAGPQPHAYYGAWGDIGSLMKAVDEASWLLSDGQAILRALEALSRAKALYNLKPIQQKLASQLDPGRIVTWSQGGKRKLRLGLVGLESGALRYVTESGEILERDGSSKLRVTIDTLAPECSLIASEISELEGKKQDLQDDLIGAAPGQKGAIGAQIKQLQDQITRRRAEFDVCIREHPPRRSTTPLKVPVADGVLASAIMPGIFPPVRLGSENYVDGGVREILPVKAALDLGGDTIYGIVGSTSGARLDTSFDRKSLLEIVSRSLIDIAIDEVALNETHPDTGWGGRAVTIIQPTLFVHDVTVIDPALIRISMGYGFMRAADVVETVTDGARRAAFASSDAITSLRKQNYEQEGRFFKLASVSAESLQLHNELRGRKTALRNQVKARLARGQSVPSFAERWWLNWEWPPGAQANTSPWQRIATDPVPAACQPLTGELAKLNAELDDLSDQADWEPHSGKPKPPANLKQRIAAMQAAVAAQSAEVEACIRQHPLPPSYGLLIKGAGAKVFIVYGGAKLWIRSPAAMNALGYDWADIQVVPESTLAQIPEDRPADGSLFKGPTDPKTYVIREGKRCWVPSPAVFEKNGFSWAEIRVVPDDTLAAISAGPDVT